MMSSKTVEEAAEAAGISQPTAYRWLKHPDVIARLAGLRKDAMNAAMTQLQEAAPEAVEALRKILREAEGESPRVSAARVILELGLRAVELGDIEERLAKLEAIAQNRTWKQPHASPRGVNSHA
jgi:hypothetical protein